MWPLKIKSFWAASAFFLLVFSAQLHGESYSITKSELTQISNECKALRLELSILKANSEADQIALQKLSENVTKLQASLTSLQGNLTDTENALTLASAQLAEAQTQLAELKASLAKSKRAELFKEIEIGGICVGVGVAIGFIGGVLLRSK